MGLLSGVRDFFAVEKFKRTPFAQALKLHTEEYFHGGSILSGLRDDNKQRLIEGMTQQVGAALQADNPKMAIREALVSHTIQYAQLQVLCLTEEERRQAFYAENPYISGDLHQCIDEAAEHVDELARHKWESGASGQDLIDFCNVRCAIYLYYMNALNLARMELGDQTDPDWYRPLVEAQLVYEENTVRDRMGLSLTVTDMIEALAYSVMFNHAANGVANPFYEWCKAWPDKYLAGRGPLPAMSV
jgi:hypothetical protein